jgi:hypothetical protein
MLNCKCFNVFICICAVVMSLACPISMPATLGQHQKKYRWDFEACLLCILSILVTSSFVCTTSVPAVLCQPQKKAHLWILGACIFYIWQFWVVSQLPSGSGRPVAISCSSQLLKRLRPGRATAMVAKRPCDPLHDHNWDWIWIYAVCEHALYLVVRGEDAHHVVAPV